MVSPLVADRPVADDSSQLDRNTLPPPSLGGWHFENLEDARKILEALVLNSAVYLPRLVAPGLDLSGDHIRNLLSGANLSEAVLPLAILRGASLQGANLSGADLREAQLQRANLRGAVLTDADLGGANLSGADLRGVVLEGTNLAGAIIDGAQFDHGVCERYGLGVRA